MWEHLILKRQLRSDLKKIGVNEVYRIRLRSYSKGWFGTYNHGTRTLTLYLYKDAECTEAYSYSELLKVAAHESAHMVQWNDPNFVRKKGLMHDAEFWELYGGFKKKVELLLLGREYLNSCGMRGAV